MVTRDLDLEPPASPARHAADDDAAPTVPAPEVGAARAPRRGRVACCPPLISPLASVRDAVQSGKAPTSAGADLDQAAPTRGPALAAHGRGTARDHRPGGPARSHRGAHGARRALGYPHEAVVGSGERVQRNRDRRSCHLPRPSSRERSPSRWHGRTIARDVGAQRHLLDVAQRRLSAHHDLRTVVEPDRPGCDGRAHAALPAPHRTERLTGSRTTRCRRRSPPAARPITSARRLSSAGDAATRPSGRAPAHVASASDAVRPSPRLSNVPAVTVVERAVAG